MNKQKVVTTIKVVLTAGLLATAFAGCCLWRSKDACTCRKEGCCCTSAQACQKPKNGANASVTLGLGTDGIHMGSDANVGSHTMSTKGGVKADCTGASVGGDAAMGARGVSANANVGKTPNGLGGGVGGGVR